MKKNYPLNALPLYLHVSERITLRQAQVDKLYAGLKDLAEERRGRLQERLRLTQLKREVDDLEQWIAEREVVAGSHELGQDYEHVTVSFLLLNFKEFTFVIIHLLFIQRHYQTDSE